MSTIEADEVVVTGGAGAPAAVSKGGNPAVRCLQCVPSLLQCLFQLLHLFLRRSHRETFPEQTNAAARGSAPLPCTGDQKHGREKTTLFQPDTDLVSQPNGLMCVHDDAQQPTMYKCPAG